jgi:hypothetical protein
MIDSAVGVTHIDDSGNLWATPVEQRWDLKGQLTEDVCPFGVRSQALDC